MNKKFKNKIANHWQFISIIPLLIIATILIIAPFILILILSVIKINGEAIIFYLTFDNFKRFFEDTDFIHVLFMSIGLSLLATVFCIIFGYPIAYILAFSFPKKKRISLVFILTIPIWSNALIRGFGMESLAKTLIPSIQGTEMFMVLGMINLFIPFLVLNSYNSLIKIEKSVIDSSYDLGANRWQTFYKVILLQSLAGVVNGTIIVFLTSMTSLIIPRYFGDGEHILIGNILENYFLNGKDFAYGAAVAMVIFVVVIALYAVFVGVKRKYHSNKRKFSNTFKYQ